jgi:hypothetical protein
MSQGNMVGDVVSGSPPTGDLSSESSPVRINVGGVRQDNRDRAEELKSPSVEVGLPLRVEEPAGEGPVSYHHSQGTKESGDHGREGVTTGRVVSHVHDKAKREGWRSMRKQARFLGRMVGPATIISLVMFGMFALLSWSIPHVLCETYSRELSVRWHVSRR